MFAAAHTAAQNQRLTLLKSFADDVVSGERGYLLVILGVVSHIIV